MLAYARALGVTYKKGYIGFVGSQPMLLLVSPPLLFQTVRAAGGCLLSHRSAYSHVTLSIIRDRDKQQCSTCSFISSLCGCMCICSLMHAPPTTEIHNNMEQQIAVHRAPASDVTITKKWAWPTDFVWQKSMEVYGKPLTTATSVVAKLPSVRLVL